MQNLNIFRFNFLSLKYELFTQSYKLGLFNLDLQISVFLLRFTSGLAATMLLWPVIQEQIHRSGKVHPDADYACPTAKTGIIGGGAFLSLDSCLFWLVALMLADNVREDHFDDGKGERNADYEDAYDPSINAYDASMVM